MAFKDIVVHLDVTPRSEMRLDLAIALAQKNGAFLRGVFAQSDPNVLRVIPDWPTEYFAQALQQAETAFRDKTAKAGIEAQFKGVPTGQHAVIVKELTNAASYADLVVLGQHDPEKHRHMVPEELVEQVILHAGRPALVVPYAGRFAEVGQRPLVAWNSGRESVRALNDALPLIKGSKHARLVVIDGRHKHGCGEAEICEHMARWDVTCEVEHLVAEDIGVMDLLLSRAADTAADMLVMGAHGGYGFPNFNRGAGTRYILQHMTVPVLMSH